MSNLKALTLTLPQLRFRFKGLYFFGYYGLGALIPLLSVYYASIGFSGVQIGTLSSVRSIMSIIAPPLWGILSDHYGAHKQFLLLNFVMALIISFFMPMTSVYLVFVFIFSGWNFFQVATNSMCDSLTLQTPLVFGNIRKWGSYGFAFAALLAGYLAEVFDIRFIFILYGVSVVIAIFFTFKVPVLTRVSSDHSMSQELKVLAKNKAYIIFLIYAFLMGSSVVAQNTFFGPLFVSLGGKEAMIGLTFFLFAISEAPFLQRSQRFFEKFGVMNTFIGITLLTLIRWIFYSLNTSSTLLIVTFIIQGITFGTYFSASAYLVRSIVRPAIRSTALTFYAAIGMGLGGVFASIIGGYIYDYLSIRSIFSFLAILAGISLLVILYLNHYLRHIPLKGDYEG